MHPPQELELLLIRHGESQFNRDGTGGFDSPLTALGMEQAQQLGAWLVEHSATGALYSSTMVRARQTAESIAAQIELPIQFDPDLREADFDVALSLNQFSTPASAIGGDVFLLDHMTPAYRAFQARVVATFRRIASAHASGTVAIVTHGGVMATIVRTIFGAHQVSVYADNTGLVLLRWMNQRWYLVFSNRREHLR